MLHFLRTFSIMRAYIVKLIAIKKVNNRNHHVRVEHLSLEPPSCFEQLLYTILNAKYKLCEQRYQSTKVAVTHLYYPRKKEAQAKLSKLQREELFDSSFCSYLSLIVRVVLVKLDSLLTMGRRWSFTGQDIFPKKVTSTFTHVVQYAVSLTHQLC